MKIDRRKVKRILFITLSNIGDIILTTPIITVLEREFPEARVDIMVGPSGKGIFTDHPSIFKVIVYNKHMKLQSKKRLIQKLQKIKYDLIVDLRNSLFPMLIGARYKTSPICSAPKNIVHKKDSHLWKLKNLGIDVGDESFSLHITDEDRNYVDKLLKGVANRERIVIVSPTAKSLIKRWKPGSFAELSDRIAGEMNASVIMVGDESDRPFIDNIIQRMKTQCLNLAGHTTIPQLAGLIKVSRLVITNDSAPMHIASALGVSVVAVFGPTDPHKYGPRSNKSKVVRRELACSPCEMAQCSSKHECMDGITTDEVYETAKSILR